jgi:hypothetical protein
VRPLSGRRRAYLEFAGLVYAANNEFFRSFALAMEHSREAAELAERHGWAGEPAAAAFQAAGDLVGEHDVGELGLVVRPRPGVAALALQVAEVEFGAGACGLRIDQVPSAPVWRG